MKKWNKGVICLLIAIVFLVSGCQNQKEEQQATNVVMTKQEYVSALNRIGIKKLIRDIPDYGIVLHGVSMKRDEDIQKMKDMDKGNLPQFKTALGQLLNSTPPEEYKQFHSLLEDTMGEFAGSLQEMDNHLSDKDETTHLTQAATLYSSSAKKAIQMSQMAPYNELQE
ncbi:hypothetical protein [Paenibacillus aestuarii]|uniref:Lipoprotein n=1 Tax=Paenibacillus aestuarii TaxID=516965 RepID=A0ABW0K378_9BACL|nr:hypothetical protein [Paenibacillus aestuarii]